MTEMTAQELLSLTTMLNSIKAGTIRLGTKGQYSAYREAETEIRRLYNKIGKTDNDEVKLHRAR